MIIYSEITEKKYPSVEECLEDEKRVLEEKEKKEKEAQKAYAEEVRALDALYQAAEHYLDVLGKHGKHGKVYFDPDELFDAYLSTVVYKDVEW